MESIGDARGFSGKTLITPSRGFSVETLTGVTLSWKTKLNRSISTMEDGIPRWLQHHYKMCCEKGRLVWFGDGFTAGTLFPDGETCIWQISLSLKSSISFHCIIWVCDLCDCDSDWCNLQVTSMWHVCDCDMWCLLCLCPSKEKDLKIK